MQFNIDGKMILKELANNLQKRRLETVPKYAKILFIIPLILVCITSIHVQLLEKVKLRNPQQGTVFAEDIHVPFSTEVYPKSINYNEHAVLSISINNEKDIHIAEIYVDATALGAQEKVIIDPELQAQTISVKDTITEGIKELSVTIIDGDGNTFTLTAEIEVKKRQYVDDLDFDWDEAVIYFLLTDRFYDGDPSNNDPNGHNYDTSHPETYHGGDFQGIIDKLDYLKKLGINTIWLTPIVDNIDWDLRHDKEGFQYGYHGYWAKDFTKIDEHLGNLDTFKKLIDEAHDRNIKIMVDVVLNHTGYGLKESDRGTNIKNFPTDEERARFSGMLRDGGFDVVKGELSGLPDFITEDPQVRKQMIDWQTSWLEKARTDRGDTIDYFRVDTVKHVEETTWKAFKNELTKLKPDFKLIGENFGASVHKTDGYLESGQMDSLLDFHFKDVATDFIQGKIERAERALVDRNERIDNQATLGQFLSSHDEDGFLVSRANNDVNKMKIAASLQMTAKGQPVIYYGEEIGQSGIAAGNMDKLEFNENRYDFAWDMVDGNDMLDHYTKLLHIRKDYSKIFAKGTRKVLSGGDDDGYTVFARTYDGRSIIVAINTEEESKKVTIQTPFDSGKKVLDVYNNDSYDIADNNELTFDIPSTIDGGTVILASPTKDKFEIPEAIASKIDDKDREHLNDDEEYGAKQSGNGLILLGSVLLFSIVVIYFLKRRKK